MTFKTIFISIALLTFAVMITLAMNQRDLPLQKRKGLLMASTVLMVPLLFLMGTSIFMVKEAGDIGFLRTDKWYNIPLKEYEEHKKLAFKQTVFEEEKLPNTGLIVLYRYGCKDCEKNYNAIKKLEETTSLIYVESRSELGIKLAEKYKIKYVPAIILRDELTDNNKFIQIKDLENNKDEQEIVEEYKDYVLKNKGNI